MNGVNFRYGKYMNGSCFSLGLVYEWGGVRGLQPHIRTQNHGKLPPPPPPCRVRTKHILGIYKINLLLGGVPVLWSCPNITNNWHLQALASFSNNSLYLCLLSRTRKIIKWRAMATLWRLQISQDTCSKREQDKKRHNVILTSYDAVQPMTIQIKNQVQRFLSEQVKLLGKPILATSSPTVIFDYFITVA